MATATSQLTSTTTKPTPLVITSFPRAPLTTAFTPADTNYCNGIYFPSGSQVYVVDDSTACLPSGFSTYNSAFFYSPGIACPSGYWTACHDTTGVSTITTVTCCPVRGDISLSCVADPLTLSSVWKSLFCTWIAPHAPGTVVTITASGDGRTSTLTVPVTNPGGVNAYGVRMVYQASDLPRQSSSSSSSTAAAGPGAGTAAAAASTTSDPATSTASTAGSSSSSTGLSTGATVAIGVVIPVIALAALITGLVLWWRRRRGGRRGREGYDDSGTSAAGPGQQQQQQQQEQLQIPPNQQPFKPPGGGGGHPNYYYTATPPPQEVAGEFHVLEMGTGRLAAELPAEGAGSGLPGYVR